jgi:hypothetical protein
VVVDEVQDLDLGAVGQMPLGGVRLPAFVGQAGLEADEGGARPLCGCGVIKPRRRRIRQMVVREGGDAVKRPARWWAMVWGPAS